jgi:hypothetical protein
LPNQPLRDSIIICSRVGEDVEGSISKLRGAVFNDLLAAFPNVELLLREVLEAVVGFKTV